MENPIVKLYKKNNSLRETHSRFKTQGYSFFMIRKIIATAGLLKKRGRFCGSTNKDELIEDTSREFRYLNDKDLNFENEVKTRKF